MDTKMWLVRISSVAVVASLALGANAAGRKKAPRKTVPVAASPDPEPSAATLAADTEGPFAPLGKTGKLKDDGPVPIVMNNDEPPPPPKETPGMAGVDVVLGGGTTGTGTQVVDQTVASFLIGGTYSIAPHAFLRLRLPIASGQITADKYPSYNSTSLGNIELAAQYRAELENGLSVPLELALAAPTSSGDVYAPPDDLGKLRHYRINGAAQATRGYEEDALFASKRFGIVPSAALRFQYRALKTGVFAKFPVLIRVGGEAAPIDAEVTVNEVQTEVVVGADVFYGVVVNHLDIGVRGWATYFANEATRPNVEALTPPSKLQFVAEPTLRGSFGPMRLGLGFLFPVGGRIGADPHVRGGRLSLAYAF